ncbi:hypothetical protein DFH27DRAFT_569459 [Peziza echinospora]|nr:hypothetical protein DFH27DRAFT_569459 [Peziza echinospora]
MTQLTSTLTFLLLAVLVLLQFASANPTDGGSVQARGERARRTGTTTRTCPTCIASPNNCDITAPCSSAFGQKLLCACRPGYRATGVSPTDTTKQWRVNFPYHEYRVWVAPGVVCDTLCTNPFSGNPCNEVTMVNNCVALP